MANPVFIDNVQPDKSNARAYLTYWIPDAPSLRATDMQGVHVVYLASLDAWFKHIPTDTTSADNGTTIIVGPNGERWIRTATGAQVTNLAARVATTENITIATSLNAGDTIDGITLANGDVVLVRNQIVPAQNGIYVVAASPARHPNFNTYDSHVGLWVGISEGTANGKTLWISDANYGGVLNTTAILFTPITPASGVTPDHPLQLETVPDPFPAVAVKPTLYADWSAMQWVDAGQTVSRPSEGYFLQKNGVWASAASNTPRFHTDPVTGRTGLLVEGARTNNVANNSMQGAAAGAPGTTPTGWFVTGSQNGISRQVVGTGTEDGIDYIDIRYSGTASTNNDIFVNFATATALAASVGQARAVSCFVRLAAGSLAGVAQLLDIAERDSVGTSLSSQSKTIAITGGRLGLQRVSHAITTQQATVAYIQPRLWLTVANGRTVDFTIRVGWPQEEQALFASSPIRTTSAAVTRAADNPEISATGSLGNGMFSFFVEAAPFYSGGSNFGALSIGDGTANERSYLYFGSAGAVGFGSVDNGTVQADLTGPTFSAGQSTRMAASVASNDIAFAVDGHLYGVDGTSTLHSVTKLLVGQTFSGGSPLFGLVFRIAAWPKILDEASLKAITDGPDVAKSVVPLASMLAADGATCWFTDPRAIIAGGALFYSTITGATTGGSVELHRLRRGVRDTFLLNGRQGTDDHDSASILQLSSGKLVVFYNNHSDTVTRYRVSLAAAPDIGGFGPERVIAMTVGAGATSVTYSNPFRLSDGNVYLFRRSFDTGMHGLQELLIESEATIEAGTATWSARQFIFETAGQRPYAKYVQNGTDRIDCFTTNLHPFEGTNASLYHIYMRLDGGTLKFYQSDGTEITASKPFDVATYMTPIQGATGTNINESWTVQIAIGDDGLPRCLSTRYPTAPSGALTNIEYWHHQWTGIDWINTRLSRNNRSMTSASGQEHYAPGLCFDGNDTSIIYMSETNQATGEAEIKKYRFNESTKSLVTEAVITQASAYSNYRPYSPAGHGDLDALVWFRGSYPSFTTYETDVYVLGPVAQILVTPSAYQAETDALVARMSVAPSTALKNAIDRRIRLLKSAPYSRSNLWSKKAADYVFQAHNTSDMLLNWKGAVNNLTVTGSPTRTVFQGVKGDAGGTAYLNGPAPNAIGAPFAQNDGHAFAYYFGSDGWAVRRVSSGSQVLIERKGGGAGATHRVNSGAGITTPIPSAGTPKIGKEVMTGAVRVSPGGMYSYVNGARVSTVGDTSAALDSTALVLGYQCVEGFLRMVSFGSALTDEEAADLMFVDYDYIRNTRLM